MKSRLGIAQGLVSAALAVLFTLPTAAGAATTTIGQLASDSMTSEPGPPPYYTPVYTYHPPTAPPQCSTVQDYLQSAVSSGATYAVPANAEEITAWRTKAAAGSEQQMTLKVFRQVGATSEYEVVAHDGPRNLTPAASSNVQGPINSFTGLSIPVQAGDVIGLVPSSGSPACMFAAGGTYMSSGGNLTDSQSGAFTGGTGYRLNLTADVLLSSTGGGPVQHTLTATVAGSGYGTVQSTPAGIESCNSTCAHAFDDGTKVTLSASPDSYSTFAGWSGGGCSGTGACEVTVGADTTVTATFNPTAPGGSYNYEYPSGSSGIYGEGGGASPTPKCHRSKTRSARKSHCVRKTKLVAKRSHNAALGKEVLTNRSGRTLYSLSAEHGGTFICTGSCLSIWHPLTVPAGVRPLGPVRLGTVSRPGIGTQVTYRGRALYIFSGDAAKGEANGQGIQDVGTWGAVVVPPPKRKH